MELILSKTLDYNMKEVIANYDAKTTLSENHRQKYTNEQKIKNRASKLKWHINESDMDRKVEWVRKIKNKKNQTFSLLYKITIKFMLKNGKN